MTAAAVPHPLEKVTFRGKTMDRKTAAALAILERRLGYELSVTQGCYNAGVVVASAGTHDKGGVIDLAPYDYAAKVRHLRLLGFAAWYRPTLPGEWSAHIHAVMIGHQDLSGSAQDQVTQFKAGTDGLAGHRPDPNRFHPAVEPFDFRAAWHDDLLRQRIRGLRARRKTLRDKLSKVNKGLRELPLKITYKS
jgi:hypothetical protein